MYDSFIAFADYLQLKEQEMTPWNSTYTRAIKMMMSYVVGDSCVCWSVISCLQSLFD